MYSWPEMGKKIGAWVMLRTAIGVSMLLPFKSGYSIIQVIIMWAVIQGVGLADHAWITAVGFLRAGGGIFNSTQQFNNDSTKIVKDRTLDTIGPIPSQVDPNPPKPQSDKVGSVDVLRSLVCMHVVEDAINQKKQAYLADMANHPTKYPKPETTGYKTLVNKYSQQVTLQVRYDETNKIAIIPWIDKSNPDYKDLQQFNGACGVYNWSVGNFDKKTVPDGQDICADGTHGCGVTQTEAKQMTDEYTQAKELGVQGMITSLDPLAKSVVEQAKQDDQQPFTGNPDQLVTTAAAYQSNINSPAMNAASLDFRADTDMNNIMTNYGWAAAGRYYWKIAEVPKMKGMDSDYNVGNYQISIAQSYSDNYPNIYPPTTQTWDSARQDGFTYMQHALQGYGNSADVLKKALDYIDFGDPYKVSSSLRYNAFLYLPAYNQTQGGDATTKIPDLKSSPFFQQPEANFDLNLPTSQVKILNHSMKDKSAEILNDSVNGVVSKWFQLMVEKNDDAMFPMEKIKDMGDFLLQAAYDTWVNLKNEIIHIGQKVFDYTLIPGFATATTAAITGNFFGSWTGMGILGSATMAAAGPVMSLIFASMFFTLPLVIAITGPMFLAGFMLSTYLPMVPFMFFCFGIISWLIFVIEAMAAAPLVALGVTHPEGHDLMGAARQAIMLWLSLFLRPLAMIIGLIAGIVLLYVATTALNAGFGGIAGDLFKLPDAQHQGGFTADPFLGIIVIMIYTFILVALVNQCFALIYVIPEKIMRWLGGHPEGSDIPQLAESVKSGITPFAQGISQGAGDMSAKSSEKFAQSKVSAGQTIGDSAVKVAGTIKPSGDTPPMDVSEE